MRTRRTRSFATAAIATLALTALAACGDDKESSSELATAACDAAVAYGTAFAQAPEDPAEIAAFATGELQPIAETLVANLDGDAKSAATTLRDAFVEIGATGDPSALQAPETTSAITTVGEAVHEGCALQAVDIDAVEYAFQGTPTTLKAGRASFALQNKGVEEHEMVLFKAADGVTEPLAELLALPEDEVMSKMQFTGVTFGGPGTTSYVAVDLTPGTYFLVCFIPQGGGEEGPPHFMGGMQQTITVA